MSLRGPFSQAVSDAAAALVKEAFFVVAAAGNDATDASRWSPASEPSLCTVGATDYSDSHARFSNFGPLVDIYGPGVGVLSAKVGGGCFLQNGTSMAAPHISGIGAYYLSLGKPASSMCTFLQGLALNGVISGVPRNTMNLLGQNGIGA
ncbi:subtilase family domain-containing protein [Pochonia chlamydosporia 170]|uniref:Subtilase family domain-containing protein n=1 Tax=Pochonia chlamydosporia 170 TaxID=1380566 RepID=A0A179F5C3_METCM|nr:subtilase family domain-containing protein [Pochonia chlamydosporia 170]OAQ60373.1 subtilase family domain-containing protein [Pochonia chlamydosporia 170]